MKYNRIKEVLREKGISQKWIAEKMGKHPITISKWSTNEDQPHLSTIFELADILKVSSIELIIDSNPHKKKSLIDIVATALWDIYKKEGEGATFNLLITKELNCTITSEAHTYNWGVATNDEFVAKWSKEGKIKNYESLEYLQHIQHAREIINQLIP